MLNQAHKSSAAGHSGNGSGSDMAPAAEDAGMAPDRREAERHRSVLRVARLLTAEREELCLVRNISAGGLMASIYSDRKVGEHLTIELNTGQSVSGQIVWIRDGRMGMAFDETVDVERVLAKLLDMQKSGQIMRMPRIAVRGYVTVKTAEDTIAAEMVDLSQGGAKLALDRTLLPGTPATLCVTPALSFPGHIRWNHGAHCGIIFSSPLSLNIISNIMNHIKSIIE